MNNCNLSEIALQHFITVIYGTIESILTVGPLINFILFAHIIKGNIDFSPDRPHIQWLPGIDHN